jgi:O-antigen/teichoic acid export membrane protein
MSVRRQAATSVFWVGVATIIARVLSSLRMLILANHLLPVDFGLVYIAQLGMNAIQWLRELGLGSALIYRQDDMEDAASTAFWLILLSSIPIYLLIYLVSEPMLRILSSDPNTVAQAVPVLRTLALTLVISSVGEVPIVLLAKDLNFRLKVVPDLVGSVVGALLSIGMAISGIGVWSLVAGHLARTIVSSTVVWFISPWRPRLLFDARLAKEMFSYGRNIAGSRVLVFLITNIDDVFVSRIAGANALGIYGFAYGVGNLPATQIGRLVGQVMFPAFSKVQENIEALRGIYWKTTRYVALLSIPASLTIIAFAPQFIGGYYSAEWAPAALAIQLLGVYGLMRSIAINMGSVFKAGGKPEWLLRIAAVRLAIMAALLYPATTRWGIAGVSGLSAVVAIIDLGVSMTLAHRITGQSSVAFLRMLAPIFGSSVVAVGAARVVYPLAAPLGVTPALAIATAIIALLYGGITWLVDEEMHEFARAGWREGTRRLRSIARQSS